MKAVSAPSNAGYSRFRSATAQAPSTARDPCLCLASHVSSCCSQRSSEAPTRSYTVSSFKTALRLAPLGISYTSSVSPLELGANGQGSRTLNYLFVEAAFSRPQAKEHEFFVRLHHRCAIYDLLNNYGANGEDFLTIGYRHKF